jgi:5-formyltetrahydrofolate cyclo-ligase
MTWTGRWAGCHEGNDVVRSEVWRTREAPGTPMIPNFAGADIAPWRLAQSGECKRARTIKTNADVPPHLRDRMSARAIRQ